MQRLMTEQLKENKLYWKKEKIIRDNKVQVSSAPQ